MVSSIIVRFYKVILVLFLLAALLSILAIPKISINSDMSKYLPDNSKTKLGMQISDDEFKPSSSFYFCVEGLAKTKRPEIKEKLTKIKNVSLVDYEDTKKYNKEGYSLFVVHLKIKGDTDKSDKVIKTAEALVKGHKTYVSGDASGDAMLGILGKIFSIAGVILMIILFLMCKSWIEPFLFLFSISIAILLNMGTNIIVESVSSITNSIVAVLQLCLSMDYSIMLLARYRQEKPLAETKYIAMQKAISGAFMSISSSSITTIVGMLALVFMSFTIGRDLGFVLAKGVFFSLVCIYTVLPALILIFEKAIYKTSKPALPLKMNAVSSFSYKARKIIPIIFILIFATSFFLKGNVQTIYTLADYDKANQIFDLNNPIVILYDKDDENKMAELVNNWEINPNITSITSYSNTLGKPLNPVEMAGVVGIKDTIVSQLYGYYGMLNEEPIPKKLSLYEFLGFASENIENNPNLAMSLSQNIGDNLDFSQNGSNMQDQLSLAYKEAKSAKKDLIGKNYGRVIINTDLEEESKKAFSLVDTLKDDVNTLKGKTYILGNSLMAKEMHDDFPSEMNRITLLTVIAIFIVIMLAFRSLIIPAILVLIIQTAVFLTMGISFLQGSTIYYLPLLIVQCLLLGATVDYGILLCSNYRDARKTNEPVVALAVAMNNSIHTILTSGLILVAVTGTLGFILRNSDAAISQILITIGSGGAIAMVLVVFILPSLLALVDRLIIKKASLGNKYFA
jgi:predicted RND superfamily exporter protein